MYIGDGQRVRWTHILPSGEEGRLSEEGGSEVVTVCKLDMASGAEIPAGNKFGI